MQSGIQYILQKALPQSPNVERISKKQLFNGLKSATRHTKTKGKYGKSSHSFEILSKINPVRVRNASKHANTLLEQLEKKASDG